MTSTAWLFDGVVVEQEGLPVDGIAVRLEHLAGGVEPVTMGQVAPRGEIHAQQPLVAQSLPDGIPLFGVSLYQSAGTSASGPSAPEDLGHLGELDPGPQDGPEGHEIGVGAAVRLGIGVGRAEELARPLVGQVLDRVDVVTPGIEPMMRNPLGVLVGQEVGHGALGRQRREVFAGDHLDVAPLVGQLLHDRPRHIGRHPGHALKVGQVGQEARRDRRGISGSSSSFRSGNSAWSVSSRVSC